jgi:hypothetical protein
VKARIRRAAMVCAMLVATADLGCMTTADQHAGGDADTGSIDGAWHAPTHDTGSAAVVEDSPPLFVPSCDITTCPDPSFEGVGKCCTNDGRCGYLSVDLCLPIDGTDSGSTGG